MMSARAYVYVAYWSEEDEGYRALCDAFPGLSCLASTRDEALHEITRRVEDELAGLESQGLPVPEPTLTRYLVDEFCAGRVTYRTLWDHTLVAVETSDDDLAAEIVLRLSEFQAGHCTLDDVRNHFRPVG